MAIQPEPVPTSQINSVELRATTDFDCSFDEQFGFRPRNQHVRRDAKLTSEKILNASDILERLSSRAAFNTLLKLQEGFFRN